MTEKQYWRERTLLIGIQQQSADSHDKAILQVAMAALGISITFLDRIAPSPLRWSLGILILSWVLLLFSIVFMIRSFALAGKACEFQIALYGEEQLKRQVIVKENPHRKRTDRATSWSHWLFIAGIVALVLFSAINLLKSKGNPVFTNPSTQGTTHVPETDQQTNSEANAKGIPTDSNPSHNATEEVKGADMPQEQMTPMPQRDPDGDKHLGSQTPARPATPPPANNPPPSNPKQ
jgi:hypothetical protein